MIRESSLKASAFLSETKALAHPAFENLGLGERRTEPLVALFLDLTNFTGRTFWDDQEETVDLAHAILSGFIEVVLKFGGHPLGLRGDGLFAGFSPGDPSATGAFALAAAAFALDGIQQEVNPKLKARGIDPVQARAGLDYGNITFVRSGSITDSEVNPLGFAANFAAKCEKYANSWEIVVGENLKNSLDGGSAIFEEHAKSPKSYTRDYETKKYRFYQYKWKNIVPFLENVISELDGNFTSDIVKIEG